MARRSIALFATSGLVLVVAALGCQTASAPTATAEATPATALPASNRGKGAPIAARPEPVVVELFSSEGCSSCPSAEDVLRELEADPGVLPLELHVDYWNGLGWADPFSKAAFSARQRSYAARLRREGVYTPQAIVDGTRDVVGSDRPALVAAIRDARSSRGTLAAVTLVREGDELVVTVVRAPEAGFEARLFATESGLASSVTRGENSGRTLAHAPVVRSIDELTTAPVGRPLRVAKKAAPAVRYVVTLSDPRSWRVLATATTE